MSTRPVLHSTSRTRPATRNTDGRVFVEPGEFRVSVGGKQPGFKGTADAATTSLVEGRFTSVGAPTAVKR